MRLDHLLSTEFFRTPVGVRSVARMPERVFGGCGRAGVEEIMGFAGSVGGLREWYGYAFGFPDRHPRRLVACGFPDAPGGTPLACGPRAGSCRGAWWFENWIVDASNAGFFVLLALSRFRQALFFGVWFRDRSFCDHFLQCDDLSSGVESYYQVFSGRVPP